ncbi:hypothetical protein A4X03_0g8163, partial [Tilletia caries]
MTSDESILVDVVRPEAVSFVQVADGSLLDVLGSGSVNLAVKYGNSIDTAQLSNVLLVPGLRVCLLSVPALQRLGLTINFHETGATIKDKAGNELHATMDLEAGVSTMVLSANNRSPIAMALRTGVNDGSRPIHTDELIGTARNGSQPTASQRVTNQEQQTAQGVGTPPAGLGIDQRLKAGAIGGTYGLILLWHRRLGHPATHAMRYFAKVASVGITADKVSAFFRDVQVCDTCMEAKMARLSFSSSRTTTEHVLALVHADLIGPVRSIAAALLPANSSLYVLTLVDDYSRKYWAIPIVRKSDAFPQLQMWVKRESVQQERNVKVLRTDGGGEFGSKACETWCAELGIARQLTAPYSSVQNGVVERANRTLQDRTRAMLGGARADLALWPLAVKAAAYQLNRTPNTAIQNKIPKQMWSGKEPDFSMLRVWGCVAWVKIHPAQRINGKTLSARGARGMFVGYSDHHKAWNIWTPSNPTKPYHISRDVRFDENKSYWDEVLSKQATAGSEMEAPMEIDWELVSEKEPAPEVAVEESVVSDAFDNESLLSLDDILAEPLLDERPPDEFRLIRDTPEPIPDLPTTSPSPQTTFAEPPASTVAFQEDARQPALSERALRAESRHIARFGTSNIAQCLTAFAFSSTASKKLRTSADEIELEPTTRKKAQRRSDWEKWETAEKEQLAALNEFGTWELAKLPQGRKPIGCRSPVKTMYTETYAPTARLDTVRILLSIAVQYGLIIHQLDVVTAYLQGELTEELYMRQPPGYDNGSNLVLRLLKPLYGLKQAGRVWNKKLHDALDSKDGRGVSPGVGFPEFPD